MQQSEKEIAAVRWALERGEKEAARNGFAQDPELDWLRSALTTLEQSEPALRLSIPIPPSTNNLFVARRDGKGRARTSAYKLWQKGAGMMLLTQPRRLIDGPVRVEIAVPVGRTRDIDNTAKPTLDLLTTMHIIQDDRYVDDLRIVRTAKAEMMTVSIWPLP